MSQCTINLHLWALHRTGTASGLIYFPVMDAETMEASRRAAAEEEDPDISLQVQNHYKVNSSFWAWLTGKKPVKVKRHHKAHSETLPAESSLHALLIGSIKRVNFAIRRNMEHVISTTDKSRRGELLASRERQDEFADYVGTLFALVNLHLENINEHVYKKVLSLYEERKEVEGVHHFVQESVLRASEDYIQVVDAGHDMKIAAEQPPFTGTDRDYDKVLKAARAMQALVLPMLDAFEATLTVQEIFKLIQDEKEVETVFSQLLHTGFDNTDLFMMVMNSLSAKDKSDMYQALPWVVKSVCYAEWERGYQPLVGFMR
eukprot:CAMPEP_0194578056 /NCGR_PEP_ID=MMETSP0292-20121207/12605_1 /TAXON_ID=39354 /ORGANISM="Heterosigma akashiwo, Strain CCMP2393" /LENGTH=316 /DNA_ID=CAMNT_0039430591 /DNA_START=33 /DNA_END=983 /DNA_ORIENTATION=-